jgi:hypothetical protein
VYIKAGNVYLSSPDGRTGYQLTANGGWSSPSQADDGTLMVEQGGEMYKATPAGQILAGPFDGLFSGGGSFAGPFGPRISPDGSNVAYWGGYNNTSTFDGFNWWELDISTIWGPSDQFAEPNGEVLGQQDYAMPSWLDNGRLLMSGASSAAIKQVAVYAIGGPDNSLVQWFTDPAAPVLEDGVASRDGTKLAFAAADLSTSDVPDQIRIYTTQGIPSGNPGDPLPPDPVLACTISAAGAQFPTFSPDGTQLAWEEPDGIHTANVSNLSDCSTLDDQLVIPGGEQPFWGPADVNMANAPDLSGTGSSSGGSAGAGSTGSAGGTPTVSGSNGAPAPTPPVHHKRRRRHHKKKHCRHARRCHTRRHR